MKQQLFIAIIALVGYLVYLHFFSLPQQEFASGETALNDNGSLSSEQGLTIPKKCQGLSDILGEAISGYDLGRVSSSQRDYASTRFRSCLQNAGFSDRKISRVIAEVEKRRKKLDPGIAFGW